MKRFTVSFLLFAAFMLIMAFPAFAEHGTMKAGNDQEAIGAATTYATDTTMRGGVGVDRTNRIGGYGGVGYDRVTTDGNIGNYGINNVDTRTTTQGRYRAAAANDMDWGWIGLVGLLGLAGLRGRNRERT